MRRPLMLAALVVALPFAIPYAAQLRAAASPQEISGAGTPTEVKAGTYVVEPGHTQVAFTVGHLGISPFSGTFSNASGTLTLDPAHLDATKVEVTIPIDSVQTTSDVLTGELKGADWFDAAKFPTATFRSTEVVRTGDDSAEIRGQLTLHGVTRPEVIKAQFFGTAVNPLSKKLSVGFVGRLAIDRSDYGVTKYVPLVSGRTELTINAAFEVK